MVKLFTIRIALFIATVGWLPSAWANGSLTINPKSPIAPKLLNAGQYLQTQPALKYPITEPVQSNLSDYIQIIGVDGTTCTQCNAGSGEAPTCQDETAPPPPEDPAVVADSTSSAVFEKGAPAISPPTFDPAVPLCDSGFTWSEEFAACVAKGVVNPENTDALGTLSLTTDTTDTAAEGGCSLTSTSASGQFGWAFWCVALIALVGLRTVRRPRYWVAAFGTIIGLLSSPALHATQCNSGEDGEPVTVLGFAYTPPGSTKTIYTVSILAGWAASGTIQNSTIDINGTNIKCTDGGKSDAATPMHLYGCGLGSETPPATIAFTAHLVEDGPCDFHTTLNAADFEPVNQKYFSGGQQKPQCGAWSILAPICFIVDIIAKQIPAALVDAGQTVDDDPVTLLNDNCPYVSNPDQADADGDGVGDVCDATPNSSAAGSSGSGGDGGGGGDGGDGDGGNDDTDTDSDGVSDATDNCPNVANVDQADTFGTTAGDACEAVVDPNLCAGKVVLSDGTCPCNTGEIYDPAGNVCLADVDTDGDGIIDGADRCPATADSTNACAGTATTSVALTKTNTKQLSADGGEGCSIVTDATLPTSFYGLLTILVVTAALAITRQFRRRG